MYRLNFGNGQVDGAFATLSEARKAFRAQIDYDGRIKQSSAGLTIERYEGFGEWSTVERHR